MNSEIKAIILDLGNYASNDKPQRDEHNVIIPFSLHYTDANLLFDYICELEEEKNKLKSKNDELISLYQNASIKINKALEKLKNMKNIKGGINSTILQAINDVDNTIEILKGEE